MSEFPSLRLNNIPLYVYTTFWLSVHLLMNSRDYFNLLATVNNAMSASVQKPQDPPFSSFGYISRNEITGSDGNSLFKFLGTPNCYL